MSTPILDENSTVRELLFGGSPGDPRKAIAESLHETGAVVPLVPPNLVAPAERYVADAVDGVLSLNLADLIGAGWQKCDKIMKAARSTWDNPTTTELIPLVSHRVGSTHRPTVDVVLNEATIATINFELELEFSVDAAVAVLKQGRLVEIQTGPCTVAGSLAVQKNPVVKRERDYDLPGAVRFGNGVQLFGTVSPHGPTGTVPAVEAQAKPGGGWYPDPTQQSELRWWDGGAWTQNVSARPVGPRR